MTTARRWVAIAFAAFVVLAGCTERTPEQKAFNELRSEVASSAAAARKLLSGRTVVSKDPNALIKQHGTQVEYHAPSGKTYLWYPGNRRIVEGEWKIEAVSGGRYRLCYRYGLNSYNPVTLRRGGSWECIPGWLTLLPSDSQRVYADNPFKLRAGPVPAVIPDRERYEAEDLMRLLGRSPAALSEIATPAAL